MLSACGDNTGETFSLGDGTTVFVSDDGDFELLDGKRPLWSMSSARPRARDFDLEISSSLGMWSFGESAASSTSFDSFRGASAAGDVVSLEYVGATITIRSAAPNQTRITIVGDRESSSIALPLDCTAASTFYGFGGQYNATDQRGESFDLWVSEQGIGRESGPRVIAGDAHTTYFPMPYFVSADGIGALLETTRRTRADLCATNDRIAWFEVFGEHELSILVFRGPAPLDVIDQLGAHIGRPKVPPSWALGLWIGAQGGTDSVNAIAAELESAQIPATALWVQDWTGVRGNIDGGSGVEYRWEVDPEHYANLPGQVASLRTRGLRFLAYANSFVDAGLDNHFDDMAAADLLIKNGDGEAYVFGAPNGQSSLPDLTNPAARAYVKEALTNMVTDFGFDGWMSDFGEWLPTDAVLADGTDALAYHNVYPVEWQRLWREVMDETRPDGDYAVFARSGYTGAQAIAPLYWIGDQETSFAGGDGLPTVVPAMLNLGLSGIAVTTHDIAGFSSLDGPSDKELYMRWTELGAFSPIMRTHDGNAKDDNWSWNSDAETLAHFARFARVHQALLPELTALAEEAARTSAPLVRHLILHYPEDTRARPISDQYLLGPDLLVAPITERGQLSHTVYLPAGVWFHVWTGDRYDGGQTIEIEAPLGSPPVFSRAVDRPELRAIR